MEYLTEELTDQFLDFLEERDPSKPFCTYMAYNAPHTSLQAPESYVKRYLNQGHNPVLATRLAMIDVLDCQIGRILDALKSEDLNQNTLVVFMTDNGHESEQMSGGLRGTKMTVWEGGIRVPLVACLPGVIPEGTQSDAICSIVDMAATFIGVAHHQDSFKYGDGHSLMPYFKGEKGNVHDQLVFPIHLKGARNEVPTPEKLDLFGVRSEDWKLVVDVKRGIDALYNLKTDLEEKVDLSDVYPDMKVRLYQYGRDFLKNSLPVQGKINAFETRGVVNLVKMDSLNRKYAVK